MNLVDTVSFSRIVPGSLSELDACLSRTAFVVSHKDESLITLSGVLGFLPEASRIIVVSNCSLEEREPLSRALATLHPHAYFVHQKDTLIARAMRELGVNEILGDDGLVRNGKGEGMYIGTLCSLALHSEWIVYYDSDNSVPCALLEYTMAMARLFLAERIRSAGKDIGGSHPPALHNIRICWSSKPSSFDQLSLQTPILGRCTQAVSPLIEQLLAHYGQHQKIVSSNSGEQGITNAMARAVRFSSGYSVETLMFLDLLRHSLQAEGSERVLLQQYQAMSPHFHQKGSDAHVRRMIAESVGTFGCFPDIVPSSILQRVQAVCDVSKIEPVTPRVYPALGSLPIETIELPLNRPYKAFDGRGDERSTLSVE